MSSPSITVYSDKPTELKFSIALSGLTSEADVRFVIKEATHDIAIHCNRINETDDWLVRVPALGLKRGDMPFQLEVVCEEFYFRPADGLITVVTTPSVQMKNITMETTRPSVVATIKEANIIEAKPAETRPAKRLVLEVQDMDAKAKKHLLKSMSSTSTVLERASKIMASLSEDSSKLTTKSVMGLVETVKHAISVIEQNISPE